MRVQSLCPVLPVDEIEPCLPFWQKLGFEKTVEVPEGDRLGFVILQRDGVQVMYQTLSSIEKDVPGLLERTKPGTHLLYFVVEDLGGFAKGLEGAPVVVPTRKTFYGATEIAVLEPGGHVVTFSEHEE